MTSEVEEPGSGNRDDRPSQPDDNRSRRSGMRFLTKQDRIEFYLVVVLPVVVFWLLLLFAPASDHLGLGEQIGAAMLVTAFFVPLMAMRFWD